MSDKLTSNIENFHAYDIYVPTKTIKIFGDIDELMKDTIVSNLHILDGTTGMVTVLLSSDGGCVDNGLAIYDAIKSMKNAVRIIGYGGVSSMASVIMQAGDERFMSVNSYMMLHEGTAAFEGSRLNRKAWERLHKIQEELIYDIYRDSIIVKKRITKKALVDKVEKADWVLTASEAVAWGLVDKVVEIY